MSLVLPSLLFAVVQRLICFHLNAKTVAAAPLCCGKKGRSSSIGVGGARKGGGRCGRHRRVLLVFNGSSSSSRSPGTAQSPTLACHHPGCGCSRHSRGGRNGASLVDFRLTNGELGLLLRPLLLNDSFHALALCSSARSLECSRGGLRVGRLLLRLFEAEAEASHLQGH